MFSDLARDDVFRLETARLWLRWPRAQDAEAVSRSAGEAAVASRTLDLPSPFPEGAAAELILRARKGNADGARLHLALAAKRRPHDLLGCILLDVGMDGAELSFWLAPEHWGRGLMSEAVPAVLDFVFATTAIDEIVARIGGLNPPALKICAKIGFLPGETCETYSVARGGWTPVQLLRLRRSRRLRLGGGLTAEATRRRESHGDRFAS